MYVNPATKLTRNLRPDLEVLTENELKALVMRMRTRQRLTVADIADSLYPNDAYGIHRVQHILEESPRHVRFVGAIEARQPADGLQWADL
jgi:hypothetical protein